MNVPKPGIEPGTFGSEGGYVTTEPPNRLDMRGLNIIHILYRYIK